MWKDDFDETYYESLKYKNLAKILSAHINRDVIDVIKMFWLPDRCEFYGEIEYNRHLMCCPLQSTGTCTWCHEIGANDGETKHNVICPYFLRELCSSWYRCSERKDGHHTPDCVSAGKPFISLRKKICKDTMTNPERRQ